MYFNKYQKGLRSFKIRFSKEPTDSGMLTVKSLFPTEFGGIRVYGEMNFRISQEVENIEDLEKFYEEHRLDFNNDSIKAFIVPKLITSLGNIYLSRDGNIGESAYEKIVLRELNVPFSFDEDEINGIPLHIYVLPIEPADEEE